MDLEVVGVVVLRCRGRRVGVLDGQTNCFSPMEPINPEQDPVLELKSPSLKVRLKGVRTYSTGAVILTLLGLGLLYGALSAVHSGVVTNKVDGSSLHTVTFGSHEGFGIMFWASVLVRVFGAALLLLFGGICIRAVWQSLFAKPQRYLDAALRGDVKAQYTLARMCWNGVAVCQDRAVAARLFRMAAEQGHRHSQSMLGLIYEDGEVVKRDLGEAEKWYRLAAAQGDKGALLSLKAMHPEEFPESSSEQLAGRLHKTADFLEGINRKIGRR